MFEEIYITEKDLAKKWGLSSKTLQRWRSSNTGPPYLRIGSRIRYKLTNIKNFEERNLHGYSSINNSSSDKTLLTL